MKNFVTIETSKKNYSYAEMALPLCLLLVRCHCQYVTQYLDCFLYFNMNIDIKFDVIYRDVGIKQL